METRIDFYMSCVIVLKLFLRYHSFSFGRLLHDQTSLISGFINESLISARARRFVHLPRRSGRLSQPKLLLGQALVEEMIDILTEMRIYNNGTLYSDF